MSVARIKELAVTIPEAERRSQLVKCAATAMSSKLIHQQKDFFSNMVRSIKLYRNLCIRTEYTPSDKGFGL